MSGKTKKLTMLAMLAAVSFVAMMATRSIPTVFGFLRYDPKDITLVISGMLFGPLAGTGAAVLVCVLEFITFGETGLWGLLMDVVSSASFVFCAAMIYKYRRKLSGAALGLVFAVIFSTVVMLLWNYLIVPVYTPEITRQAVAGMLIPVFLPFNLIKSTLNASAVMLLYKPIVTGLRRINLMPPSASAPKGARLSLVVAGVSLLVMALSIVLMVVIG
ncbi:MAG: ECF transporter S component [Clostridiales bacterium]|jgi:riboflavin transporter FmnP|nr:ECF transporter S component [Clostridiales bacterium]